MKKGLKKIICLLSLGLLFGCDNKNTLNYVLDQTEEGENIYIIDEVKYVETEEETNFVKIDVDNYGIIIAELYEDKAPITVENFKKLVGEGFYSDPENKMIFHRVIKDFMIQTGDPTGTGMGGSANTIKGEFELNGIENNISHKRGVLSMARRGASYGQEETSETMDSASSQFFIVHKDSTYLDGNYAAFGEVKHGMDVVDKIASTSTDSNDKPLVNQVINSITFVSEYEESEENIELEEGE